MKLQNGLRVLMGAGAAVVLTALPAPAARVIVNAQFVDRLPAPPMQRLAPILDATVRLDGRFIGFTKPEGLGVIELPVTGTVPGAGTVLSDGVRFPFVAGYAGQPIDDMTELVVIYRPGVSVAAVPPIVAGFPVKHVYEPGRYVVLTADNQIFSSRLLWLLSDPRVEFIEPNYHYFPASPSPPDDPDWTGDDPGLWGLRLIRPAQAWQRVHEASFPVAVVDSGIQLSPPHPDLQTNLWRNSMEASGTPGVDDDVPPNGFIDDVNGADFVQNDGVPQDTNGHGTQVAGIIAAVGNNHTGTVGVLWAVPIIAVRVFQSLIVDSTAGSEGIEYAVNAGARVINISWAGRNSQSVALSNAITHAQTADALVVAAVGNISSNLDDPTQVEYPAGYAHDNIVAVLAIDEFNQPAGSTGYGAISVDIGAPYFARSTTIGPVGYTQTAPATSFATPFVSGALALTWAADPTKTAHEVKQLVLDHAVSLPLLAGKCVTGGRVDLDFIGSLPREAPKRPAAPTLIDVAPLP